MIYPIDIFRAQIDGSVLWRELYCDSVAGELSSPSFPRPFILPHMAPQSTTPPGLGSLAAQRSADRNEVNPTTACE
jgi:hypothetical protein